MRVTALKFLRYVASGATNTALTYLLYLLLLNFLPYISSYVIAFIVGIGLSYVLQRYFVFSVSGGRYGLFFVSVMYLAQLVLGTLLVHIWVQIFGGAEVLAPAFSAAVCVPLTFLISRKIFRAKGEPAR
jgi:putative flippase GtrA